MSSSDDAEEWGRKDGRAWRIGRHEEIAWIDEGTRSGLTIRSAIPPMFAAYATLELPGTGCQPAASPGDQERHDAALLAVLGAHAGEQPWWLGYLETGGSDIVFHDVRKVTVGHDWRYVLVKAGAEQAGSWREQDFREKGALPDLMFPADRSWLLSTLWDDDWTCIGGSSKLIGSLSIHSDLRERLLVVDQSMPDTTPPGHVAI